MVFDLMPTESDEDVAVLAERMAAVPAALAGYRESLRFAADGGKVSAVRQIDKCAEQCDTYAGAGGTGFFAGLAESVNPDGVRGSGLSGDAGRAPRRPRMPPTPSSANSSAPSCAAARPESDAVGRERYVLASRNFLGAVIDLEETYAWGWQEFLAIEAELRAVAERIAPGAGPAGAAAALDADPAYQLTGLPALQAWMQDLSDRAIAELGRHPFRHPRADQDAGMPDRPARRRGRRLLHRAERRLQPPGTDVVGGRTRPRGVLHLAGDQRRLPRGRARPSPADRHRGLPQGHPQRLPTAAGRHLGALPRAGRCTPSGWSASWATCADDGQLLGLLESQMFRTARVIVDIGMHLELEIPAGTGFHEGERWTGAARPGVPADQDDHRPGPLPGRDRPLPRVARSGTVLQGGRAGLAGRSGRRPAAARRRLRRQGVPHCGAEHGRHGPRPARRPAGGAVGAVPPLGRLGAGGRGRAAGPARGRRTAAGRR